MKKQASKKKLVEQTVANIVGMRNDAAIERISTHHDKDGRDKPPIYETNEKIIRYLDTAANYAQDRARHILPKVADVKAHPLPAFQDLTVTPISKLTLKDTADEITDYLNDELRYFAPRMMRGLEDFLVWYQGMFLEALRHLNEKKIVVCDTLGKSGARQKLVESFATLPKFTTLEAFEDYSQRILAGDDPDPTEEIVRAWRKHQPAPFPDPDKFAELFRVALKKDAEAIDEINGNAATAVPTTTKKTERQSIVALVYQIYTSNEWQRKKLKGDETPKNMSYSRAIRVMLDEPIPRNDPFYEQIKEAREIVKKMAKGGDDAKIRNSLRTQVINYAKSIKPTIRKTLTIGQAVSRLSPYNKQIVRDALDYYGEDHYDHNGYMGVYPTIGDSSAYR